MRKFLFILFLVTNSALSQQLIEPLELSKLIFSNEKFNKLKKYTTGEYKEAKNHPNGTDLSPSIEIDLLLLSQSEKKSVVAMTLIDSTGKSITDVYLHYELESDIWKLAAFRGLAMTGFIQQFLTLYNDLSEVQIDSLLRKDTTYFKSRKQFDFELANSKLTLATDEEIIKHFKNNSDKFQNLVDRINKNRPEYNQLRKTPLGEKQQELVQQLLLRGASDGAFNCSDCIEFTIGGMIDNSVGYMYITDPSVVPNMNPNRYIMIRKIAPNWYIFKTT